MSPPVATCWEPVSAANPSSGRRRGTAVPESGARILVAGDPDPYGYSVVDPNDTIEPQPGDVRTISLSPAWWSALN